MIDRILPACIDNRYRGHRLGLWLFVPITFINVSRSLTHLFKADGGAQSISTIPLDTYSSSAAQNIVGLFARIGLEQLLLASLFVLVLVRYRAMIPLMYVLIVAHYIGARVVSQVKPLVLTGTSGVRTPFLVIAVLSVAGLVLSLIGRGYAEKSQ
ncbi:MAG: hypothetical protein H0T48_17210 [Gemmatimonadaceae bacterium]|nr:hypothetical protein [Gemmatimonadaceae bacterium]